MKSTRAGLYFYPDIPKSLASFRYDPVLYSAGPPGAEYGRQNRHDLPESKNQMKARIKNLFNRMRRWPKKMGDLIRARLHAFLELCRNPGQTMLRFFRAVKSALHPRRLLTLAGRTCKWSLIVATGVILLFSTAVLIASLVIDAEDLNSTLKTVVAEQTGGELELGDTKLNLFTGVHLRDVRLYVRPRQSAPDQKPLLSIDAVDIGYRFAALFIARISLNEAMIHHPVLHLEQMDDQWNFQPILDHIAALPKPPPDPDEEKEPEAEPEEEDGSKKDRLRITRLLPVHPSMILALPVRLALNDIGFTNLEVNLRQVLTKPPTPAPTSTASSPKKEASATATAKKAPATKPAPFKPVDRKLTFRGLSTRLSLNWFWTTSETRIFVGSQEGESLLLQITGKTPGADESTRVNELDLDLHLSQVFTVEDFDRVRLGLESQLKKFAAPGIRLSAIQMNSEILVSLLPGLDGIKFTDSYFKIDDLIDYRIAGSVAFLDGYADQFQLDLNQSLRVSLDTAGTLLKQLKIPVTTGGIFQMRSLRLKGPLRPAVLSADIKNGSIPNTGVELSFDKVRATVKEAGISVNPIDGFFSLAANSPPLEDGIRIETDADIRIGGVALTRKLEKKTAKVNIRKIVTSLSGRFAWPGPVVPFVRISVDIPEIKARMQGEDPVRFPLAFEVFGNVSKKMEKISLNTRLDIGELLELAVDLRCRATCNRFRLSQTLRMDDFSKLYAFVRPVLAKAMPLNQIPTLLTGKLNVRFDARGSSPNIKETNPDRIIARTKAKISSAVRIENFSTKVPLMNLGLENFGMAFTMDGDLKKQILEIRQRFDRLSLDLPAEPGQKPKQADVRHYSFDTKVRNTLEGFRSLKEIKDALVTHIDTRLYVGQVNAKGILPKPLNSLSVNVKSKQTHLKRIDLQEVAVRVPDAGLRLDVNGNAHLSPAFMPTAFTITTGATVQHMGGEGLASGITTSGSMTFKTSASSKDMKSVKVDGRASFDHFNVKVAGPTGKSPLFEMTNANGDIPIRQVVDLTPFLPKTPPPGSEAVAEVPPPPDGVAADEQEGEEETPGPAGPAKNPELAEVTAVEAPPTVAEGQEGIAAGEGEEDESDEPDKSVIEKYYKKTRNDLTSGVNLVTHVDFDNVKGFYPGHRSLTIDRVFAANLEMTDLEFDIEVRQNWFALNRFSMGFLAGKIQGNMQLAFDPLPDQLHLAIHVTRLNTHKLIQNFPNLRKKAQSWSLGSEPWLDATVHLNYDVRNNDMGGGIHITTIGKEQLRMMLYYLDPELKNPSLSSVRQALTFGDVSHVSIPIRNGFIDFDVGVSVLAVPVPLPKLQRFPVGQLVSNFASAAAPVAAPAEKAEEEDGDSKGGNSI